MADPFRVLFVCLHGSAKSIIAAEYFQRIALARGFPAVADSLGVEPDEAIPPHVVRGLGEDGFDAAGRVPKQLTSLATVDFDVVVSFGCPIDDSPLARSLIRWDDVPAVSDGYSLARDDIVARVERLVADLVSARTLDANYEVRSSNACSRPTPRH